LRRGKAISFALIGKLRVFHVKLYMVIVLFLLFFLLDIDVLKLQLKLLLTRTFDGLLRDVGFQ
jgi:hypothetical protein